jgi:hypothetical protein
MASIGLPFRIKPDHWQIGSPEIGLRLRSGLTVVQVLVQPIATIVRKGPFCSLASSPTAPGGATLADLD